MHTIIIVGAARSGTKILRDVLAKGLNVGAVPYDIGYIWSPQASRSHDEIAASRVSAKHRQAIRRFIHKYAEGGAVIEKTVANSLRVPLVKSVFPEAVVVSIVRDGVDVAMSSARQWSSVPEASYMLEKLRHFPPRLIPTYGWDYFRSTVQRYRGSGRTPSWGPRYDGIEADINQLPLEVVCARQWVRCVTATHSALPTLDRPAVEVRYEEFVADPSDVIRRVADETSRALDESAVRAAAGMVRTDQGGKGRSAVPDNLKDAIAEELNETLLAEGYPTVD